MLGNSLLVFNFWLLLTITVSFSNSTVIRSTSADGLYVPGDDVEILTAQNFEQAIYSSNRAWFVEFYSSWCGYCQRYAPFWKELATSVKNWKDIISVAAMDCSNEENSLICSELEVIKYPSLRYFHENYVKGPNNFGTTVQSGASVVQDRHNLLKILINEQRREQRNFFPNLQPYIDRDVYRLSNPSDGSVLYSFLIVQEPSDYVGPEVVLDLHKIKEILVTYSFRNNTDLVQRLGTKVFPCLYVLKRDNIPMVLNSSSLDRAGFKNAVHQFLISKNIAIHQDDNGTINAQNLNMSNDTLLRLKAKNMGDIVFKIDLESALRYSLKREVGAIKIITGDQLEALRKYVTILVDYFPVTATGKQLLKDIKEYILKSDSVSGREIYGMVKQAENPGTTAFSSPQRWLGCQGSSPTFRGYPCGLWKLFHYLTVNAQESHKEISNPKLVLEAMHGYIKNFFGCLDCSYHFLEMCARRRLSEVSAWDESVLWLWRAHNEVNNRLHGDQTEDPEYPKVQFPTQDRCPACYKSDNSWNEAEVLTYLKRMYLRNNINDLGTNVDISLKNSSSRSNRVFQSADASMRPTQ